MMPGNPNTASRQTTEEQSAECKKLVSDKLGDEATQFLLIQKLKESGHVEKNIEFKESCDGGNPLLNSTPPGGDVLLTFPLQYPFAPFPALPFWGPVLSSPWVAGTNNPSPPLVPYRRRASLWRLEITRKMMSLIYSVNLKPWNLFSLTPQFRMRMHGKQVKPSTPF